MCRPSTTYPPSYSKYSSGTRIRRLTLKFLSYCEALTQAAVFPRMQTITRQKSMTMNQPLQSTVQHQCRLSFSVGDSHCDRRHHHAAEKNQRGSQSNERHCFNTISVMKPTNVEETTHRRVRAA